MVKYTLQRLLAALITLLVTMTVIYVIINLLPNQLLEHLVNFNPMEQNVVQGMPHVTDHTVQVIMERFRWDQPLPTRFLFMLRGYLTGDFGISLIVRPNITVWAVMAQHLPVTIQLNFFALFLILPLGIFFGISTALTKDSIYDHTAQTFVVLFIAAPVFVVAALMQYWLAFRFGWFPILLAPEGNLNWTRFYSMILPIIALSFGPIAHMARVLRAELTEAITSDYMLLARAKGQSYKQAIIWHALRNACVPLTGTFLFVFLGLLSGSLIIEQIFSIPGIARVLLHSISAHDYQLTIAILYFYVALALAATILVDLGLAIMDPRIRMGGRKDA